MNLQLTGPILCPNCRGIGNGCAICGRRHADCTCRKVAGPQSDCEMCGGSGLVDRSRLVSVGRQVVQWRDARGAVRAVDVTVGTFVTSVL